MNNRYTFTGKKIRFTFEFNLNFPLVIDTIDGYFRSLKVTDLNMHHLFDHIFDRVSRLPVGAGGHPFPERLQFCCKHT